MPQTSPMNWIIMVFIMFNVYMLISQILSNMSINFSSQLNYKLTFLSKNYKW